MANLQPGDLAYLKTSKEVVQVMETRLDASPLGPTVYIVQVPRYSKEHGIRHDSEPRYPVELESLEELLEREIKARVLEESVRTKVLRTQEDQEFLEAPTAIGVQ